MFAFSRLGARAFGGAATACVAGGVAYEFFGGKSKLTAFADSNAIFGPIQPNVALCDSVVPGKTAEPQPNIYWISVSGSGTPECDGLYCPSTAAPVKSESGTMSSLGYWNGKMAWDRVDGKAKRNPSISYSNSYKAWRIARLDGHLAYTIVNDDELPTTGTPWDVYKKGEGPAPKVVVHTEDPRKIRPKVVFVLGGPGAGKGTMCELAQQQLGWEHLSAGDLLRAERKKGGEKGAMIEEVIKAGKIVPDEVTVGLLKTAMEQITVETGHSNFLIDGFPRSLNNHRTWVEVVGESAEEAFMLFFECPLPVLEQRILGRAQYSGRSDDNIESLRQRFRTYKNETMPIVNVFREKGKCVELDSSQPRQEVYAKVKEALSQYTDPALNASPLTERSEILLGLRPWPKKKKKAE